MKILHVETGMHLYGGARQVAYLLEGLARRGVEGVLACPPGAAIGRHCAKLGLRVRETACGGDLDLGFALRLHRLIREVQPQLVHLHSRRGADVLGGLAAQWAGVPAVLSRRVDNPEAAWWARRKYARYAHVICISEGIAAVLRREGVSDARLKVVRSAVDARDWTQPASRDAFCATFGVDRDRILVGVVAQLIVRKGHRVLLDALHGLPERERVQIVCFGQGPEQAALERTIRETGLSDTVRFAGFRDDLADWMGCLDLVVHPAFMEGLGVSLLQASAAGVPIIASRVGGIPEAVRDGENGLLVPPGDADALRQSLQRLLGDVALRQRLGAGGRALIAREFSLDAMVEGNLAVYREVCASPSTAR